MEPREPPITLGSVKEYWEFPYSQPFNLSKLKKSKNQGIAHFYPKKFEYTQSYDGNFDSHHCWEKAISTPSKAHVSTDLTLTIHDNIQNDYMTYHALWYTYIKTAKLGLIDIPPTVKMDMFYDATPFRINFT